MVTITDKITALVAILMLTGAVFGVWNQSSNKLSEHDSAISSLWSKVGSLSGTNEEIVRLREKVDHMVQTNERSLIVFDKLADSVDKLSVSVARLDERTRQLEKENGQAY